MAPSLVRTLKITQKPVFLTTSHRCTHLQENTSYAQGMFVREQVWVAQFIHQPIFLTLEWRPSLQTPCLLQTPCRFREFWSPHSKLALRTFPLAIEVHPEK